MGQAHYSVRDPGWSQTEVYQKLREANQIVHITISPLHHNYPKEQTVLDNTLQVAHYTIMELSKTRILTVILGVSQGLFKYTTESPGKHPILRNVVNVLAKNNLHQ